MVTFPEAVKSVACAHEEGVFSGTTLTVDWNELSLCNILYSSKIWSLCTCFYVVGSAASVVYIYTYREALY